jgi:hypothetical protein
LRDILVCSSSYASIQILELVVIQVIVQVQVVNVSREPCPECDGNLALQELDHGIRVRGKCAYTQPLDYTPQESLSIARDEIAHDLSIEARYDEGEICPQHEEDAMADQETRLLAVPTWYHDVQQA